MDYKYKPIEKIIVEDKRTLQEKLLKQQKMVREEQKEIILNNKKAELIDYENNLSLIYEHFCNLSYTHYNVNEMIKKIEKNVISRFCEMVLDDCEGQDFSLEELKEYLAEEVIDGYKPMK